MNNDPLIFELATAHNKPSSFRKDKSHVCPFCDVAHLTNIYETNGKMIWLHNRFPTLRDTLQTVLIETDDHHGDVSTYSAEYNRQLLRFAYQCFEKLQQSGKFQSVLWYKNFGPLSAGSLSHPHMQIVGLNHEDGYKYMHDNNFEGVPVYRTTGIDVNFAQHPIQGYQEINVNLTDRTKLDQWSDWIQKGVQYTLQEMYQGRCNSYNLFFYPRKFGLACKIIPRFYASPYFVGYKLSQCNDESTLKTEAQRLYNFACKD